MAIKYTRWPRNKPNGGKIDEMSLKFPNIFHYKTLKNEPKLAILFWKYNIWQHRIRVFRLSNKNIKRGPLENGNSRGSFFSVIFFLFFTLAFQWIES
jgi:hypothetical protein